VQNLTKLLTKTLWLQSSKAPIVLCIGSDRVTGDSFGPMVGEKLTRQHNIDTFVYGTLSKPVTAINLIEVLAFIKCRHPNTVVLAVDSALGATSEIGKFRVLADGIYPGAATGKKLPKAGDFSLTATVAPLGTGLELYGVQLGFIDRLAETAALAIADSIKFNYAPNAIMRTGSHVSRPHK